jgi:hypothetical protein
VITIGSHEGCTSEAKMNNQIFRLDYIAMIQSRIKKASSIASEYSEIDGAHHKQWVIDQMLRVLLGKEEYDNWLKKQNYWDCGVAP